MATNSTKMATNSNEEKPPLQPRSLLTWMQAQIQKNLATDFTKLLNAPKWNIFAYQQFVCQNWSSIWQTQCGGYSSHPTTATIHTVSLSQVHMHHNYSSVLKWIAAQMTTPPATMGSLSYNLRQAQKETQEIKHKATQRWEAYLQELLDTADKQQSLTETNLTSLPGRIQPKML